jgi:Glycosyltransferase family 87
MPDPDPSRPLFPRGAAVASAVIATGLLLRLALSAVSSGSNDIFTWEYFATHARDEGVLWMYTNFPGWNHPPLMGFMAASLLRLSEWTGLRFAVAFKLAAITADGLCLLLLWRIWGRRTARGSAAQPLASRGVRAAAPLAAIAIFSFSPNAILISAYHGNTDPLVGLFILAACVLIEEHRRFFWAGVALAAAVNVKLIPLILAPVFLANIRRWPEAVRFCSGLSLGAVPFAPVIWQVGDAFYRNAIAYDSNFDRWGIPLLIHVGTQSPRWAEWAVRAQALFVPAGRYLVLSAILALCAWSRWRRPLSTYQLAAGGLSAFLVLAPGFGVQYTAIVGPVLVAASLRWGLSHALTAGVFVGSVYYQFWTREGLLESHFVGYLPAPSYWIGLVPWIGLLAFLMSLMWASAPPQTRTEGVADC